MINIMNIVLVDSIREDFDHCQNRNNDLRMILLTKRKRLDSIGNITNDLSAHLGILGAKLSVNQKKYLQQVEQFSNFENELDDVATISIGSFESDMRDILELQCDMLSEFDMVHSVHEMLRCSLINCEVRRETIMTSFSKLTSERDEVFKRNSCCNENVLTLQENIGTLELNVGDKNHDLSNLSKGI